MKEITLEDFLKNCKVSPKKLDQYTSNEENIPYPLRDIFFELNERVEDYFTLPSKSKLRMLALSGLRGIGKTTLMWQLAKKIYDSYTQDIYFFNIEAFIQAFGETKLYFIFQKFQEIILKKPFDEIESPIIFLCDEVHEAQNWGKGLKILYDQCPRAFIISTGSSALLLEEESPDLAQRWNIFHVFPFKFSEFVQIKSWRNSLNLQNYSHFLDNYFSNERNIKESIKIIKYDHEKMEKPLNIFLEPLKEKNIREEINDITPKIKEIFTHKNKENQFFPEKDLEKQLKNILFFSNNIEEVQEKIAIVKPKMHAYIERIEQIFPNVDNQILLKEYINYYNVPRFFATENKEIIIKQTIDMFDKIMDKDVFMLLKGKLYKDDLSFSVQDILKMKNLLTRMALSGEFNMESNNTGCSIKEVKFFVEILQKAEILNVFSAYGGLKAKINKNKKLYFMSPTLRIALNSVLRGDDVDVDLQAILYEEIVAMYLKKLLHSGLISFAAAEQDGGRSPDFVIETLNQPIILEVKTKKIDIGQIVNSKIDFRYGILVVAEADDCSFRNNTFIMPLRWFLLL